ncbi:MAG: FtsX-like permease family protein [Bacteroidota bacterium]
MFFEYRPINVNIVVRIQAGNPQRILEQLTPVYQKYHPGYPFEYTFLNDDYNKLYESDTKVSMLSTYFAVLATLISCLGLFGLAVFSSERRTKEIGIRKVLGATSSSIVRLLANDLVRPVFIAIVIAIPLSFFVADKWLMGFAYRIELSWWFFAVAGVIAVALTWLTVALQDN